MPKPSAKYIFRPIVLGSLAVHPWIMLAPNDSPARLTPPGADAAGMSRCGLITYGGRLVAIAAPRRVLLMAPIAVLESDHPRRRFVATLALVWREMRCGAEREPYDAGLAQFYARWILMPNDDFARLATRMSDTQLAEHFNVPAEQVPAKREDLEAHSPGENDDDPCV